MSIGNTTLPQIVTSLTSVASKRRSRVITASAASAS